MADSSKFMSLLNTYLKNVLLGSGQLMYFPRRIDLSKVPGFRVVLTP